MFSQLCHQVVNTRGRTAARSNVAIAAAASSTVSSSLLSFRRSSHMYMSTTSPSTSSTTYDVFVVGAGVVGASLACSLATNPALQGLRIAILEPAPPTPASISELKEITAPDLRTFAITPSSKRLFERAGAWDMMSSVRTPSFSQMQVWDALGPGYLRFQGSSAGGSSTSLGWIVEDRVLRIALYERLKQLHAEQKLTLLSPAGMTKLVLPPSPDEPALPAAAKTASPSTSSSSSLLHHHSPHSLAQVTLSTGKTLQARLVVGADGAMSKVRDASRIGSWGWDYDQRAVVASVTIGDTGIEGDMETAWQRFLPNGPVAILPLSKGMASIVWSTTPSHADYLTSLSPHAFTDALNTVLTAPPASFAAALRGEAETDEGESQQDYSPATSGSTSTEGAFSAKQDILSLNPFSLLLQAGTEITSRLATASFQRDRFRRPPMILATVGPRASFPLKFMKSNAYVRPRVALVGDAAHVVHPLAGQGLNLGIGDANALASIISTVAGAGGDVGTLPNLRKYEANRSAQNLLMMSALDGVKRLFTSYPDAAAAPMGGANTSSSNSSSSSSAAAASPLEHINTMMQSLTHSGTAHVMMREPVTVARNLGMVLLNGSPHLKKTIATYAMGGAD